jgi:tetratricopeptide (TPR) repeat protein
VKELAGKQPQSSAIQHFLGTLSLANGDRRLARESFTAALSADPRFLRANLSLVQLDVLDRRIDDARNRLVALVSANPRATTPRLWLGNLEEFKGNHAEAMEHFRQVVEADPGNTQALNNLAYLLLEYGNNPDEALKYAQKAQDLEPGNASYEDTLGWAFYRKGLYGSAMQYLQRAGAANEPGAAVRKYHLAMAYAKAGDMKRAREVYGAALRLNPNLPEANTARELIGDVTR